MKRRAYEDNPYGGRVAVCEDEPSPEPPADDPPRPPQLPPDTDGDAD